MEMGLSGGAPPTPVDEDGDTQMEGAPPQARPTRAPLPVSYMEDPMAIMPEANIGYAEGKAATSVEDSTMNPALLLPPPKWATNMRDGRAELTWDSEQMVVTVGINDQVITRAVVDTGA